MDSVHNDISVLFDVSKAQTNVANKQTKNQVFESILNSLQKGTKKSLKLKIPTKVKKSVLDVKKEEPKTKKDFLNAKKIETKKSSKFGHEPKSKLDLNKENSQKNIEENQPKSQDNEIASSTTANVDKNVSQEKEPLKETNLNSKKEEKSLDIGLEVSSNTEDDKALVLSSLEQKAKELLYLNIELESSSNVENNEDLELNLNETLEQKKGELVNLDHSEAIVSNEKLTQEIPEIKLESQLVEKPLEAEDDLIISEVVGSDIVEQTASDVTEAVNIEQNISDVIEPVQIESISDEIEVAQSVDNFDLKGILQNVELLQSSPELREVVERVLDVVEDFSDQDLQKLEIENPQRLKEIIEVLSTYLEKPTKEDALFLKNEEVKNTLENIEMIILKSFEISSGEIDISSFELVDEVQTIEATESDETSLKDTFKDLEISEVSYEEAEPEPQKKEFLSVDEIKKDLKMMSRDVDNKNIQKEEIIKESLKLKESGTKLVEKVSDESSELVKKSQTLVRVVVKAESEYKQNPSETVKVDMVDISESSENSSNTNDQEKSKSEEDFLAFTKNFTKNQNKKSNEKVSSKFDLAMQKASLVTEKVVSKEIGLSIDGSRKITLTKLVRHPGFQSSTKVIVKQIQDMTKLINPPKVNRLTMQLKPERLGEVRLEIKQVNGVIKLSFEVENQAVKEIIEKNIHQLKETLKIQNIDASEVEVNVKEQKEQDASNKEQQSSKNSKRKNQKSFDLEEELKESKEIEIEENYRVNQYA